ncbi:MAG: hypothetical protein NZ954_00865 [Thermofilaceae archaeon]|nr:hypothetical protein [Thermofilaceae archaeon]MCX8180267.1 hypothetical protein [Thermofilaceae archaeon]MDW8004013.1 hypothetical protein [Thermofilaceae archaeon]
MARQRVSYKLAVAAVMSALAIVISLLRLEIPFYPLVFLKFDLAEIPSVMTFALVDARWSYLCALAHFLGLLARGSEPLGASMKFLAVVSMLLGLQVARRRWKVALISAALSRIAVMSVVNFVILGFLFPFWLDYSSALLARAGLLVQGREEAMAMTLLLIALFNGLHVVLSVVPATLVTGKVRKALKL